MNEAIVRYGLQSRWRGWIVITLTFGIGLLFILPAVDEFTALSSRRQVLTDDLNEIQELTESLGQARKMAAAKQAQLAALEARTVPQERLPLFRGKVVELARSTSCQVRRVNVGEVRRRDWRPGDDPLSETPGAEAKAPANYMLRQQPASLSISGKLSGVEEFLVRLARLDLLLHVNQFSLQPADAEGRETNLELDLILFDLAEAEHPAPKPAGR